MNTPNKDSTAQDTSDVDVAPASASPKQEDDDGNESEKEMMTTTMSPDNKEVQKKKMEVDLEKDKNEERDQCSICLEDLPKWAAEFTRMTCCGNGLHKHCNADLMSTKMRHNCILCRAKVPTSDEESVKQLRPWVKKKKAWAMSMMGQLYRDGKGAKQSYEMAKRRLCGGGALSFVLVCCILRSYCDDHSDYF
jgi:hypothetical protein